MAPHLLNGSKAPKVPPRPPAPTHKFPARLPSGTQPTRLKMRRSQTYETRPLAQSTDEAPMCKTSPVDVDWWFLDGGKRRGGGGGNWVAKLFASEARPDRNNPSLTSKPQPQILNIGFEPCELLPASPALCRDDRLPGAGWGTTRGPCRCPGMKLFHNCPTQTGRYKIPDTTKVGLGGQKVPLRCNLSRIPNKHLTILCAPVGRATSTTSTTRLSIPTSGRENPQ
jgi:hypothetical protein